MPSLTRRILRWGCTMIFRKNPLKEIQGLRAVAFSIQPVRMRPVMRPSFSVALAVCVRDSYTIRLDPWKDELHATQDALLDHQPRWLLLLVLTMVLLIEF